MQSTAAKVIEVVAAVVTRGDEVLLALRPKQAHKGGLWEFPGGKVEAGESQFAALQREILEELAISISMATPWQDIRFDYPEKSVHLFFWKVSDFSGEPLGAEGQDIRWVKLSELGNYDFPEANQAIVNALMAE